MNTKTLQYLVAVADEKHFGRAADACFVTQSTLSIQIKKMEEYLGVALINRSGKNVALTPKGLEVVSIARGVLSLVSLLKDVAKTECLSNN